MSQQGERPSTEDDWWNRLYDESTPDTGPATRAEDTLDDRFDSVSDAVSEDDEPGRPRAWWETDPADTLDVPGLPEGLATPTQPYVPPQPKSPPAPGPSGRQDSPPAPGRTGGSPPPGASAPTGAERPDWPFEQPAPAQPAGPSHRPPGEPAPPAGPETPDPRHSTAAPGAPDKPTGPPPPLAPEEPATPSAPKAHAGAGRPTGPPLPGAPEEPATPPPPKAHVAAGKPAEAGPHRQRAPWEPPVEPVAPQEPAPVQPPRPSVAYVGDGPPTYGPEPTALPAAGADELGALVADTVLDGAQYGTYTLRAASLRGDSARFRGEPRRDALLTARFGSGAGALVLVAVASGARAAESAHLAAAEACRWIGGAVGRSHARLSQDIRAGRRGDLKSGLQRLTDRSLGKMRARAAELGVEPEEYAAGLRCLLLSADPECRTRVFFGVGPGGLLRLRDGAWQDIEPAVPEPEAVTGAPVVGYGSAPGGPGGTLADIPSETPDGDRLTMDFGIPTPPSPYIEAPPPPPAEPFRFRASVARPGDTLLLCSPGLADPLRGERALADELAARWSPPEPPGLAAFLADTQLRVKGYADDRTAVAVWEA